jgi:uncharacterized membrane protein YgcG
MHQLLQQRYEGIASNSAQQKETTMAPSHILRTSLLILLALFARSATAQQELQSTSFTTCSDNSSLTAESFYASLFPEEDQLELDFIAANTHSGVVTVSLLVTVDGESVFNSTFDPCQQGLYQYFCPSTPGQVAVVINQALPAGSLGQIPESVYTEANPEAYFELRLNDINTNEVVGCLQAQLASGDASSNSTSDENVESGSGAANNTSNGDDAGSSNATTTENDAANTSSAAGGSDGGSGASTAYLNWTLLA